MYKAATTPQDPIEGVLASLELAARERRQTRAGLLARGDGIGAAAAHRRHLGGDPRSGHDYVNEVYLEITGGAARRAPTAGSIVHVGNAGMCFQDSVKLDELRQPLFVETRRLLPDTEGAGRCRGALRAYSVFGPTMAPMCVAYVNDGNINPARGTRGGLPSGRSAQSKRLPDGSEVAEPACVEVWLEPGEMIVLVSARGGGYADPWTRDPDRVRHDVAEGWISATPARNVYGVAIAADGSVDQAATAQLRALRSTTGARGGEAAGGSARPDR